MRLNESLAGDEQARILLLTAMLSIISRQRYYVSANCLQACSLYSIPLQPPYDRLLVIITILLDRQHRVACPCIISLVARKCHLSSACLRLHRILRATYPRSRRAYGLCTATRRLQERQW